MKCRRSGTEAKLSDTPFLRVGIRIIEGHDVTPKGARSTSVGERGTDGAVPMYQPAQRVDTCTESIIMRISARAKAAKYRFGPCARERIITESEGQERCGRASALLWSDVT